MTRRSAGNGPAALYYYSPTRGSEHPEQHLANYSGLMQADAYSGYNGLYVDGRKPGMIIEAACWAHGRRKFFELADLQKAPVAIEAVRRIDELFAIEREINGQPPDVRIERSPGTIKAARRSARNLAQGRAQKALVESAGRQSHGLQPEAMARVHALPR